MKELAYACINKRCSIAIVHNTVAPYRHPLFEMLSNSIQLDPTVYYCSKYEHGRKWELWPKKYQYKHKFLPGITLRGLSINPTIVSEIVKRRFEDIIGGFYNITWQIAFIIGQLLKIPMLLWEEGVEELDTFLWLVTRPIRMFFIKKANAIIVPGKLSRKYVISMGANKSKVFIAPNCVANELFIKYSSRYKKDKERLKQELKLKKDVIILYVGQLIERKGVEYLLRAYKRLKHDNLALIILGNGPLKKQLKSMCRIENILNVYFIESKLRCVDLIKYYSVADVFVLPTLMDVWGFVINEAMACGLPVVATKASQAAIEMVRQGENGYVVKEADIEELFRALQKLVCNAELRERMAKRSREIVTNEFDVKHMVNGFMQAINYAMAKDD